TCPFFPSPFLADALRDLCGRHLNLSRPTKAQVLNIARHSFTIRKVRTWDVIIIGGGIIGLSLAIALRKRSASVLVVEGGGPGREASYAAGGMLVECSPEIPAPLQAMATASARLYPEFAHELQLETGITVDLRDAGTIVFPPPEHVFERPGFTT